jgi:hypothetical protein
MSFCTILKKNELILCGNVLSFSVYFYFHLHDNSKIPKSVLPISVAPSFFSYKISQDRNKGDGDGEGETKEMGESLDKEEEDEEHGTDRSWETTEMTDAPTKEEVKAAVDKLKNNKAPSPDGIPSEILKEGYKYLENRIYGLIVQIWDEERISLTWVEALICPNCENFR